MTAPQLFAPPSAGDWVEVPGGSRRRVVLSLPELMLVEFAFEAGGVGALHAHPHAQASYIVEGAFEVTIDGATRTLAAGGAYIVPPGKVHGVRALEKGRLIDNFTPCRDDFL
ncbi:cupin domain-containing protein [Devosia sp.]|uniref:cupin domain-containing protein n=1 Tax=Devosia sp. TaxID=1871048 RepID=UPI002EF7C417